METNNKLREALDLVDEGFSEGCLDAPGDCPTKHDLHRVSVIREKVKSALAEPQRNCDRFGVREEAWAAFRREYKGDYEVLEMRNMFDEWLFAPATEKEGGAK